MKFTSTHIKGKGRGKKLGFPTINLQIPFNFDLKEGIYGGWVYILKHKYLGAIHYGTIPTFNQIKISLEVFLIDVKSIDVPYDQIIEIDIFTRVRDVRKFSSMDDLTNQLNHDIQNIRKKSLE